ncbi:hypothetical protein Cfla_0061 [Cellulomonas flavigena DSM 20109]|uniref:Pyrrolo-quinoline quinone repeat domain-containing protein n=1 Tax=Cellulomonas flavigena (strain ATCC 482 / DSM 20109 / BCRC 11376 / JCM 18109 / NBRC 3775 / NCIMB 8073 / NRS 134) TaxID=446466 RepID=D5UFM2_CELFN|nr:PQQ-binding-like beta-propeller repeat protein [Cellulomonas flavigena]ADG72981.1 hypothetical protein Cfla_0061 [Cellulomonas flavigena DSM 20109]
MARRPTLHEVEVVDDESDPGPSPPAARPAVPRRGWVLGGAVLAVLLAVGVTAQVLQTRRDRAQVAAVAAHAGGVALLDGPPAALWQLPTRDLYGVAEVRTPEGLLVGVRDSDSGPVEVAAVDAVTGAQRWHVELVDGATRPQARPGFSTYADSGRCAAHGTQEHLVVCLAHDGTYVVGQGATLPLPPSTTRLVVLDTRAGTLVADLGTAVADDERPTSFAAVGDLVVVTVASQRGTTVRATTLDGAVVWERPVTSAPDAGGDPYVLRLGELVALLTAREMTLLDADGRTVRTRPLGDEYAVADAETIRLVPSDAAAGDARTTVVRPAGDLDVPGDVLHLTVDDGSVPGLVLTTAGGELTALVHGEELWSVPDPQGWNALVVGGRVHLDAGLELLTLDARTGAELWTTTVATTLPVTDGRHLLAVARPVEADDPPELVALDPADGSVSWRSPLPPGSIELTSHLGLLLVSSGEGAQLLTVLG